MIHPIRKYRHSQRPPVSQEELARRVDTTKGTISRIERGSRTPSLDLAARLSRVTKIPIDKFVQKVGAAS